MVRHDGPETMQHPERAASAVEYAILVALIATVIVTVVATLGGTVTDAFDSVIGLF